MKAELARLVERRIVEVEHRTVLEEVRHTVEEEVGHIAADHMAAVVEELRTAGVGIGLVVHCIAAGVEVGGNLAVVDMGYWKAVHMAAAVGAVDNPDCTGLAVGILLVARILEEGERGSRRSLAGAGILAVDNPEEGAAQVEVAGILLLNVSTVSSSGI